MVNAQFIREHEDFQGAILNNGLLDHCPILLTSGGFSRLTKQPFRYFNAWVHEDGFYETVRKAWEIEIIGTPMFRVVKKLSNVKSELIQWHKNQQNINVRILEAQKRLNTA